MAGLTAGSSIAVPGRVNLIGDHIDYHNLSVLPMAIQRHVRIAFRPRATRSIRAVSSGHGEREFEWTRQLEPSAPGDWENYLKAAAQAVDSRWDLPFGIDAEITSDLPPAAGLSSSSALLTAVTLALLQANGIRPGFEELMEVLPEGEYFVGTRGGGMDHAAVLASRPGTALLVNFAPLLVEHVEVPRQWRFLVAHSLVRAEKSGDVRAQYNARRTAGSRALERLRFDSYASLVERMPEDELRAFLHVTGEGLRVRDAVRAMRAGDAEAFGRLMAASHESLRDQLRVSCAPLDELVAAAIAAGAYGARLTGAGFGGCAVILCDDSSLDHVRAGLVERYYSTRTGFDPEDHLINVQPSCGALYG